jgi:hypothetical protein
MRHEADRVFEYMDMDNHFARLTGLEPDTAYYFVVKDDEGVSERYWFRTAPATSQPFTFITGSDVLSWPDGAAATRSNRMVPKLRPLFVLFNGDFTSNSDEPFHDNADEWSWWFDNWQATVSEDGRMFPILPSKGNHETIDEVLHNLFDIPHAGNYYALSFGGTLLRLYVLNTDLHKVPEQQDWLARDLAEHEQSTFLAAAYHKPMRPHTTSKREYTELYDAWAELFYNRGMDLCIEGHGHVHKITYPLRPSMEADAYQGFVTDFERGIMFIGEGTWGNRPRKANDRKPWTMTQGEVNQFKWIHVYPERMEIRTVLTGNPEDVLPLSESNVFAEPKGLRLFAEKYHDDVVHVPFQPKQ